jgi:hypothetical protein
MNRLEFPSHSMAPLRIRVISRGAARRNGTHVSRVPLNDSLQGLIQNLLYGFPDESCIILAVLDRL